MVSRNAYKGGQRSRMRQLSRELAEECLYAQRLVELTERCVGLGELAVFDALT